MSLLFQNGAFFPLIIIAGLFGSTSSLIWYLFIFSFASTVANLWYLFAIFQEQTATGTVLLERVINPMAVVTIVGIFIGLVGIKVYIPNFLHMIFTLIGAMAIPLFMLILGGNVYNDFLGGVGRKRKILHSGKSLHLR